LWYYERVRSYYKSFELSDLDQNYRVFMVPGMAHCVGGGAEAFGGPGQRDASLGGGAQSLVFDPAHDMILATIQWVEKDIAPKSIIGASYVNGNRTLGAAFTRPLCPYPQEGVYKGGNINDATSYACEYEG